MRRTSSSIAVVVSLVFVLLWQQAAVGEDCAFDPGLGRIVCNPGGSIPVPGGPGTGPGDDPGRRYIYTATDPVIGDCYFWSDVPGGIDAWDPGNDPTVIAITTTLPLCPSLPVDPEVRAWEIFRSWDLAPPDPEITPPGSGITGLPTNVAAVVPAVIRHDEVLPDGRPLSVRARVTAIDVDWGDGSTASASPDEALPYPDGSIRHVYLLKTCTTEYRERHPSGGLCHPTLDRYEITVAWSWTGEFDTGAGWIPLGVLVQAAQVPYDVDELRGVNVR